MNDPESGIKCIYFKLAEASSQNALTSGRWHAVSDQVSTIKLSTYEDMQHQVIYKMLFRVVNNAGLESFISSQDFMWDKESLEWQESPSSLPENSTDSLHYVPSESDQVTFTWKSAAKDVLFTVSTCIIDNMQLSIQNIPPEQCDSPIFVGNSTSFMLGGDKVIPGRACYVLVCMFNSECKSACRKSFFQKSYENFYYSRYENGR
jgi:hypothetical protein